LGARIDRDCRAYESFFAYAAAFWDTRFPKAGSLPSLHQNPSQYFVNAACWNWEMAARFYRIRITYPAALLVDAPKIADNARWRESSQ
jgi:hypothetical protein